MNDVLLVDQTAILRLSVVHPVPYTTASLRYRAPFFLCLLIILVAADGRCETDLTVSVTGVEGRLHENIMARLRINIFRENSNLNETEIRRLHRLAEDDITSALAPYGYYDVTVEGRLERDEAGWQAEYTVRPGEPVVVTEVSIAIVGEGRDLPELTDPAAAFPLQAGEALNHQLYEQGKRALLRRAAALGLLDASYTVQQIQVDRKSSEARIELLLDTGMRYLFGTVDSEQRIISEDLLARFVPFKQGDPFSRQQLQELQRDLYRTDYFGSVIVVADTTNPDGRSIPVTIDLEPQKHYNRYSFGVGYATDIRAHVRFEWLNRMLNDQGHRAFSSLLVGEQKNMLLINYGVPVADPRYNTVTASGLWNSERWEDTETDKISVGLAYDHATPEYLFGVSVEVLDESFRIGATRGSIGLVMPGVKGSWSWADDVINTENGLRLSVDITGASKDLLSDASFVKLRGDGKIIISPLTDWRLIGRGSIGGILIEQIDEIPPSVRFYAGGDKSVRGYRYRSLGPKDESDNVVGGRLLLTGSAEIEYRLSQYWRAAVFYDAGNAMDDLEVDLAHGLGIGVGLVLPFGQARLDLAVPLNDEGRSQTVFLSVGADL